MSISVTIKKIKGREYIYIVDIFRDPITKRPTTRTLRNYGNKEALLAKDPDAMQKIEQEAIRLRNDKQAYGEVFYSNLSRGIKVMPQKTSLLSGRYQCSLAPYRKLWELFGLDKYFKSVTHNNKLVFNLDLSDFSVSRIATRRFGGQLCDGSDRPFDCGGFGTAGQGSDRRSLDGLHRGSAFTGRQCLRRDHGSQICFPQYLGENGFPRMPKESGLID